MADISLDMDKSSPTYRDLLVVDGDLVLTNDVNPDGTQPVVQNIMQRLRFFLGEWFMDTSQGLPWLQQVFVKVQDQGKIDALFLNTILGTDGVLRVIDYSFSLNRPARVLTVKFKAIVAGGQPVTVDTTIPLITQAGEGLITQGGDGIIT